MMDDESRKATYRGPLIKIGSDRLTIDGKLIQSVSLND